MHIVNRFDRTVAPGTALNRGLPQRNDKQKVLLIDREMSVVALVAKYLRAADFHVTSANSAEEGSELVDSEKPDLVVLDLVLPGMSGAEFCKSIKRNRATSEIGIIFLTSRHEEIDRLVGFEIGADDYVTKPFSPRELVCRAKSVLRRSVPAPAKTVVTVGPITLDFDQCHVRVHGRIVHLTPKEFKMLALLAARPGVVHRRATVLCEVWGDEDAIDGRSMDTYFRRLRAKLGAAAKCIETVYGFGYRLAA